MADSITPPPELVAQFWREASAGREDAPIGEIFNHGVYLGYQAGADQELEACLRLVEIDGGEDAYDFARYIRAARRPKPPSLKEQALAELAEWENVMDIAPDSPIRRALEAL
jgi:hypothetical protein